MGGGKMTIGEFVGLVESMRMCQRDYFRNRSPSAMEAAKRLEGQVDREIRLRHEREADKALPGLGL
jgi:hypothetical protein